VLRGARHAVRVPVDFRRDSVYSGGTPIAADNLERIFSMKKSERFALDQWLSDYPGGMAYADIIGTLTAEDDLWEADGFTPWEVVEAFPLNAVAVFIDDTRVVLERCFPESLSEEGAA
jgi:hypothetical protein